ncbi:MAG: 2-amino-4-hydroxy-6-hydroxymethyldihydropteridine diphosphokinase, partial [Puniceicoccales bacterium]
TPPWGPAGQERYWNAVVEVDTELEPDVLLAACLGVEESLGRVREVRWGPRNIDLDLLLYGDRHWRSDRLVIPHPRMTERAFVLRPLADLIPEREVGGKSILNWLKESSEEGIERVRDSVLSCQ